MNLKKEREPAANSGEINAFLGKGTDFNGKLTFEGTVRLDGKFSGEIFSPGILIIGESATVDANINVNTLIVSGKMTGNIDAKARVEIHAPGKLYGNINSPVLVIDEGVIFEGSCKMETSGSNKVSILDRKDEDKAAKS